MKGYYNQSAKTGDKKDILKTSETKRQIIPLGTKKRITADFKSEIMQVKDICIALFLNRNLLCSEKIKTKENKRKITRQPINLYLGKIIFKIYTKE